MKRSNKILLIAAALFTASGAAVASQGFNCDQRGSMQGNGPATMQGMHQMQGQYGMKQGMNGGMGAIYQLDNLTDTQKQQIAELRKEQHDRMFNQREQMLQNRAEMKQEIGGILTEEQRAQLNELRHNR